MKLNELTLEQASKKLQSKEISSLELTKACISSIDDKINAFITKPDQDALNQAKSADESIKKTQAKSEIDGAPIAIKDNIAIKDTKITAASKILENFIAPYDATVIKKLRAGGAVFFGKTNMDEFACGSSTETSYFGSTLNPVDNSRVPGGSSGGSAAAVASNQVIASLGSDTGGSIRQPASFCGIVGLKPTYGRVSRYGLLAMASSLDQIGTLTKTVFDSAMLLNHISGYDKADSTSVDKELINLKNIKKENKKIKIGVPKEVFGEGLSPEVSESIKKSIKIGQGYGFEISEINLKNLKYALSVYYILMPAEVSSNLERYDGIKYGFSDQETANLIDVYFKTREKGFGAEIKRRIMLGTYVLSAGYYDAYYKKAQKVRAIIKQEFDKIFEKYDFILTPTSPTTAFKLGEKTDNPLEMYLSDIYTVPVNIAGLPAISIPCGNDSSGLPIGLQIIGSQWSEENLLNVAYQFEKLLDFRK